MKVYAINLNESDWGYNRDEFFCLNRNKKQTEDLLKRLKVEFPNKNIHMIEANIKLINYKAEVLIFSYSDYDSSFYYSYFGFNKDDLKTMKDSKDLSPLCTGWVMGDEDNLYLDKMDVETSITKDQMEHLYGELGVNDYSDYRMELKKFLKNPHMYNKYNKYYFDYHHLKT